MSLSIYHGGNKTPKRWLFYPLRKEYKANNFRLVSMFGSGNMSFFTSFGKGVTPNSPLPPPSCWQLITLYSFNWFYFYFIEAFCALCHKFWRFISSTNQSRLHIIQPFFHLLIVELREQGLFSWFPPTPTPSYIKFDKITINIFLVDY